ncbi:endonuclease/exonuclease/phosphatase family protein [Leptolyngbya sp. 7M]|uniref:endonuclease/exonuclease/phosphatase family protein n=1 Tax=Leptolyngbya sp. 7M TaxID=2812896 RepID=UPI001B8D3205|nr:endonuclease/exonuclease/phosphatase family protein [Leptolyngbya sp. 7M]QYO66069.1 endonuclease/exonuclease/phosphatase family protein [Leptolyngbya sp. 7M]
MRPRISDQVYLPSFLEHDLNQRFDELLKFDSLAELESAPIHAEIKDEAERILNSVIYEEFSCGNETAVRSHISALAWNIERGNIFEGILDALKQNANLSGKDVLLLTELDHGMARSGNRFVAQDLARELRLNYAFAPVYIALQKGSGVEAMAEGENTNSIHGLAMFSKWPMRNIQAVPLPNGKDKMWGKEKRLGWLRALVAEVQHPAGIFRAVTVHLDAHCSRAHRRLQMQIILDHLDTLPEMPTLIGGDWNTTTFNSQSSTRAIMGYWRRVFMGPKNVAKNHLPHPERFFEKALFDLIEGRGYRFRDLNNIGTGTLHYHVESIEKNTNLRDWVPEWCFPFIFWAANRVGGSVSSRLDWFAGKGIVPASPSAAKTIGELRDKDGTPLSDHDAISLDFRLHD